MFQAIRKMSTRQPFYKIYPNCVECIYYNKYKFDDYGKCIKFEFETTPQTDEKEYEYADYVRRSESKCGHDGRYYKKGPIVRNKK